ncbi:MAG TPA: glucans biosynthesis glucosyltransferase MdoH [Burkholderiales bacterium]
MELHSAPRLARAGAAARDICLQYLERLPLSSARRRALLARAARSVRSGRPQAMASLHAALGATDAAWDDPARASLEARLDLAAPGVSPLARPDARGHPRLQSAPPITRTPMAPYDWPPRFSPWTRRRGNSAARPAGAWRQIAAARRTALLVLVLVQTWLAVQAMKGVLPYGGEQPLELVILALFAVLFGWISAGFWTALAGFVLLLRRRDPFAISAGDLVRTPLPPDARTAIVMPICNENVARVYAGLRATYESVRRTGELARFDFFVLSDSDDPDVRVAEIKGWLALCRAVDGFGRIFYRRRRHRIKRKSGNVADFCRRWGARYRYMVVLDADSVMGGECLTALVRLMEANPDAGIIQTVPQASGRETLYARIQQFAHRVYGPLFAAGMHFWQLGESHYWGHNAIIRLAPFMRYCAIGRLPRRGRFGGEILSHDFVEAALMSRAGYSVWLAYDLPGSHEELPPNLIDELGRDRRWCQGNVINAPFMFARGICGAHRALFATGVMAYLSGLLWFLFLLASTLLLAVHQLVPPTYFVAPKQLFPLWPQWNTGYALTLFAATTMLLFLPKLLGAALAAWRGAALYGGTARLFASTLIEMLFSMLLAPIRMLFHAHFIATALFGWPARWKSPLRGDAETTWAEALRRHGVHTLIGVVWAGAVVWLSHRYVWWLLPVLGALILSVPISVLSSRVALGRALRRARLLLIPEESRPPPELRAARRAVRRSSAPATFVDAVVDPLANALACAAAPARPAQHSTVQRRRVRLVNEAAALGPARLPAASRRRLLDDAVALSNLHFEVWASPAADGGWLAPTAARTPEREPGAGVEERARPAAAARAAVAHAEAAP